MPKVILSPNPVNVALILGLWSILEVERGSPVRSEGAIRMSGATRLATYLLVPSRGSLELELHKPPQPLGDGFRVTISVETDGSPATTLLSRAFGGAQSGRSAHTLDLSRFSGRAVRLAVELDPGDFESVRGDTCVLERPRLLGGGPSNGPRYRPPESPQPPIPATPMNIVVVLLDALRARDLSCYGEPSPTSPHIDRLSREGVLFTRNFSQAPNTPPSVKALLTGRYLPTTGHRVLASEEVTLAERLATAGYHTAAFSNTPFVGDLMGTHQGFQHLPKDLYVPHAVIYSAKPPPKDHARRLREALAAWRTPEPFFAYLHAVHPHNPYTAPSPWDSLLAEPDPSPYDGTTATLKLVEVGNLAADPEGAGAHHRLLYQQDIAAADFETAALWRDLASRGLSRPVVMSIIADHGEEFLEHGGVLHGYTAFDEMLHVPLILSGADLPPGRLFTSLTETIDLAPMLLHLPSLPAGKEEVFASASSVPGIYSLRTDRYKYVYAPGRAEGAKGGDERADRPVSRKGRRSFIRRARIREPGVGNIIGRLRERAYLYDLESDPLERTNAVGSMPILAAFLHRRLMSWLETVEGQDAVGQGTSMEEVRGALSPEECRRLAALGYVDGESCP